MKIDYLFWGSSILCVLTFVLFALQIIAQLWRTRRAPAPSGLGDAQRSFATSGPIWATAVVTIIFALVAVLASGIGESLPATGPGP